MLKDKAVYCEGGFGKALGGGGGKFMGGMPGSDPGGGCGGGGAAKKMLVAQHKVKKQWSVDEGLTKNIRLFTIAYQNELEV